MNDDDNIIVNKLNNPPINVLLRISPNSLKVKWAL